MSDASDSLKMRDGISTSVQAVGVAVSGLTNIAGNLMNVPAPAPVGRVATVVGAALEAGEVYSAYSDDDPTTRTTTQAVGAAVSTAGVSVTTAVAAGIISEVAAAVAVGATATAAAVAVSGLGSGPIDLGFAA